MGTWGLRLALVLRRRCLGGADPGREAWRPRCRVTREPDLLQALLPRLRGAPAAAAGGGARRSLPIDSQHPDYVSLSRMPPWLPAAFITAEDGRFFDHPGFDLEIIRRALAHDFEVADFAKGASTITQQLAKNLFLGPERTFGRKLEELVLAWRLHERAAASSGSSSFT